MTLVEARVELGWLAVARPEGPMSTTEQSSFDHRPPEDSDQIDEAALAEVMRVTPLGAAVVAGTAIALMVLGFIAVYLLVFLPRGSVG